MCIDTNSLCPFEERKNQCQSWETLYSSSIVRVATNDENVHSFSEWLGGVDSFHCPLLLDGRADVYMGGTEWQQVIDHQKAAAKILEQKYKDKLATLKVCTYMYKYWNKGSGYVSSENLKKCTGQYGQGLKTGQGRMYV